MDADMATAGQMKRDQLKVFSDKLAQYLNKVETFSPEKYRGIPDDSLQKVQTLENESYDLQQRYDDVTAQIGKRRAAIEDTQTKLSNTEIAVRNSLAPYQKLLERLKAEETKLRGDIVQQGKLPELKAYLLRQAKLVEEEESLKQELIDKEAHLAELRSRLCGIDIASFPDHERANAELYKKWKTYLKQKNDVERDFREQKLQTEENIKTRQEVQEVLADMERQARLVQLEIQADNYAAEIEATKARVEDVKRNIAQSASAIQRFRAEFEQMRTAIMLNKTVKSSQVEQLLEHRQRMQRAEESFLEFMSAQRDRVVREEAEKWQGKVDTAKDQAAAALRLREQELEQQFQDMRRQLTAKYEAGFAPLLQQADIQYTEAKEEAKSLEDQIAEKEAAIRQEEAEISELQSAIGGLSFQPGNGNGSSTGAAGDNDDDDEAEALAAARNELERLWVELNVDPSEVAQFLSDIDMNAPYCDAVFALYQQEEARLLQQQHHHHQQMPQNSLGGEGAFDE